MRDHRSRQLLTENQGIGDRLVYHERSHQITKAILKQNPLPLIAKFIPLHQDHPESLKDHQSIPEIHRPYSIKLEGEIMATG